MSSFYFTADANGTSVASLMTVRANALAKREVISQRGNSRSKWITIYSDSFNSKVSAQKEKKDVREREREKEEERERERFVK